MINNFKTKVHSLYKNLKFYSRMRGRKRFTMLDLEKKLPQAKDVDKTLVNDVRNFWEKVIGVKKVNYSWFEIYNSLEENKDRLKYYVPDEFWYTCVDSFYTDIYKAELFDDKNLYDLYFHDVRRPRTIVRKIEGAYLDADYNFIDEEMVYKLCVNEEEIIIKAAVNSCGGTGIKFWNKKESKESLYEALRDDNIVVQEIVKQHEIMSHLHEGSLNTVRIMILIHKGEVIPLSTVVRMGVDNAKIDNASSGGIVCGVNSDGRLKDCAYNTKAIRFDKHPQGAIFQEHIIPNYDRCLDLAKKLAPRFAHFSRLQSWDIAIDYDGEPSLIEANLTFGQIDFHQMCNGPILGNRTEEVLKYVTKYNKFINKIL